MKKREDRRDRTFRYGENAWRAHCLLWHAGPYGCTCKRGPGHYAKGKSMGCPCRRVQRGLSPKVPGSLCHGHGTYHPCVIERIAGNRLCKAWLAETRAGDLLDVEL